jgi:long-chain acyl-CoA synthetase
MMIGAVEAKWQLLEYFGKENAITRIFDKTIFAPVQKVTGGKLIYGLSGGAPVSFETSKFLSSTLCHMVQGYG